MEVKKKQKGVKEQGDKTQHCFLHHLHYCMILQINSTSPNTDWHVKILDAPVDQQIVTPAVKGVPEFFFDMKDPNHTPNNNCIADCRLTEQDVGSFLAL
jgi:hypothetical protein